MLKKRLIAVLILRDRQVVQSVRFKHTNVIHYDPIHAVDAFNKWSVDEIVMLNVSPSYETRQGFVEEVSKISRQCFVPLAVGGWITDDAYAQDLLRDGGDKLVVNTIIHDDPELVSTLASRFGNQCIVGSMDLKRDDDGTGATVRVDRGQRDTSADPVSWAEHAVRQGCGELLVNSINHDGARRGYDVESIGAVAAAVDVPVIAFGGVFSWSHLVDGINAGADAVAVANQFHYTEQATKKAKVYLSNAGVLVRQEGRFKESSEGNC